MKKRYDEEYEFAAEVTGFLHGGRTENYCRNGEGTGDRYTCSGDSKYSKKGRLPGRLRDLPPDRKAARQ